jgi:mono/diheme cytochrome c family protein
MTRHMRRAVVGALMVAVAVVTLGLGVGPAVAAEIGIAVGAPESATVGTNVEVKAIVTSDDEPLEGAIVELSYSTSLAGIDGRVELVSAVTDADGIAVMIYEQRAADNGEMRVEYAGPDDIEAAPFVFAIAVESEQQQLYAPISGIKIPFLNGSLVIAVIAGVWSMIAFSAFQLVRVGRAGQGAEPVALAAVASEQGSAWVATILTIATVLTAVGMVIVFLRTPLAPGDPLQPERYDRSPIAFLDAELPYEGVGLADDSLAETGDPIADGEMRYFQYGCASCHGLSGAGAVVGPELLGEVGSLGGFVEDVREGPKEMPGYASSVLSDDDLELIHRYLKGTDGA